MNIVSNNPSHVISVDSQKLGDSSFSANFKILNISTLRNPEVPPQSGSYHSTESRHKTSQLYNKGSHTRLQREHRNIAVKSAFSEEVTGKNTIEVNACAVTKYLHITLLCLRPEAVQLFHNWKQQASFCSSQKSKISGFNETENAKNQSRN